MFGQVPPRLVESCPSFIHQWVKRCLHVADVGQEPEETQGIRRLLPEIGRCLSENPGHLEHENFRVVQPPLWVSADHRPGQGAHLVVMRRSQRRLEFGDNRPAFGLRDQSCISVDQGQGIKPRHGSAVLVGAFILPIVIRRGKKSWRLKFDLGRVPLTGKRRTTYQTFRGSKREAETKLAELITTAENGVYVTPDRLTLGDYLRAWLEAPVGLSPKTLERYRQICGQQIIPHLGGFELQKLTPAHVQ